MTKPNVLFLVHVEEMFRDYFPDEMFVNRLIRSTQANKYDSVFCLCSGLDANPEPIRELVCQPRSPQIIEWGWGYEPECFDHDEDEKSWVIPALGHEYTWIPEELRTSRYDNANIFVGGGCESECLQDFVDILDYLKLGFEKIRGLIY